jgi:NAD(P)-dependent dehydrogenase (short-subunit alcohol dehydrogenase family)
MMRLKGKVAIVTGGSSGIGRASAELFAREGARVVVADYKADSGRATAEAIKRAGGDAMFVQVDVSDSAQVQDMVQAALDAHGGIDILLNTAGILLFGTVLDTEEKDWRRVMDINLTGTFLVCRAVLPHMIKRGGGSIINLTSSTGAHDAGPNTVAYVSSKGGVALMTRAMAIDHAKHHVRVNAVAPGPTDTPMLRDALSPEQLAAFAATFPMGRLGRPEELANAILFLASDEASFVTGAILAVDGGQTAQV